nr:MAG TPA: hypothetical protein [Caudoviricetes sp.]
MLNLSYSLKKRGQRGFCSKVAVYRIHPMPSKFPTDVTAT